MVVASMAIPVWPGSGRAVMSSMGRISSTWLVAALAALGLSACTVQPARVDYYYGAPVTVVRPLPPPRVEYVPAAPGYGYFWESERPRRDYYRPPPRMEAPRYRGDDHRPSPAVPTPPRPPRPAQSFVPPTQSGQPLVQPPAPEVRPGFQTPARSPERSGGRPWGWNGSQE